MKSALILMNVITGVANPHSTFFCPEVYQVCEKILKIDHQFDDYIVVKDAHVHDDSEFKFLPEHFLEGSSAVTILPNIEEALGHRMTVLKKTSLNALHNEHNKTLLLKYDHICLAGFHLSIDILPTALSLLDFGKEILIQADACGDILPARKEKALEYLRFMGVPIMEGKK